MILSTNYFNCLAVFVYVHPIFTALLCKCVRCQQLYKNFNPRCGSGCRAYIIILEQGNIIALQHTLVHFCNSAFLQWCVSALAHYSIIALIHWYINSLVHNAIVHYALVHYHLRAHRIISEDGNIIAQMIALVHWYINVLLH